MALPTQSIISLQVAAHDIDYRTRDIVLQPSDILINSTALDNNRVEKFVYSRAMVHHYVIDRAKICISVYHAAVYWGNEQTTRERLKKYERSITLVTGWQLMEVTDVLGYNSDTVYQTLNGFQYQVIGAEAAHDDEMVLYLLERAHSFIGTLEGLNDHRKKRIALFQVFAAASYYRLMRWEEGLAVTLQALDISYDGRIHANRLTSQLHSMVVIGNIGLYGGKHRLRQAMPWWDPDFIHIPKFNCRPAIFLWLPEGLRCLKSDVLDARALSKRNARRAQTAVCPRKTPRQLLCGIIQAALDNSAASKASNCQGHEPVLILSVGGAVAYRCRAKGSAKCVRCVGEARRLQILVEQVAPMITGETLHDDTIMQAYRQSGDGAFDSRAFRSALHASKDSDHVDFLKRYPTAVYDDAGKYVAYLLENTNGGSSGTDCFLCGVRRLRGAIATLRDCIYAGRHRVAPDEVIQLVSYVCTQFGNEPTGRRLLKNWLKAVDG